MKRILTFFIVIGIIVGIIIGIKNPKEEKNEHLVEDNIPETTEYIDELILSLSEVDTLDPLRTKNIHTSHILKLIYEPLFSYDNENQIEPVLAEEWMQRDDYTWIIRIKENIKWHDGENLTAR